MPSPSGRYASIDEFGATAIAASLTANDEVYLMDNIYPMEVTEIGAAIEELERDIRELCGDIDGCQPDDVEYYAANFELTMTYEEMFWYIQNCYQGA